MNVFDESMGKVHYNALNNNEKVSRSWMCSTEYKMSINLGGNYSNTNVYTCTQCSSQVTCLLCDNINSIYYTTAL